MRRTARSSEIVSSAGAGNSEYFAQATDDDNCTSQLLTSRCRSFSISLAALAFGNEVCGHAMPATLIPGCCRRLPGRRSCQASKLTYLFAIVFQASAFEPFESSHISHRRVGFFPSIDFSTQVVDLILDLVLLDFDPPGFRPAVASI